MLIGAATMLICLLMEATFVILCLRRARFKVNQQGDITRLEHIAILSVIMLLMLLGNLVQIAIWGGLFMLLGEFGDFATALYHSGVNYAGLGYGDIVMSERRRPAGAAGDCQRHIDVRYFHRFHDGRGDRRDQAAEPLEHRAEKWGPVFRKNDATTNIPDRFAAARRGARYARPIAVRQMARIRAVPMTAMKKPNVWPGIAG